MQQHENDKVLMSKKTREITIMRLIIAMLISGFLLMGVSTIATAAYVFKWTDEEGNVHFSDKPVGENVELHQVKTQKGIKGGESRKEFIESQKNKNGKKSGKGGNDQAQGQEGSEEQGEMTKEQVAQRKKNCERTKKNLKSYEATPRLYREDDKGERVYLDDSQREKAIEKTRKSMEEWCD